MHQTLSRPTNREIDQKIRQAKLAVSLGQCRLGPDLAKLAGELMALEIGDTEEVWPLINDLLAEIELTHYKGAKPPLKSYEPKIKGCELFAFAWESKKLRKHMYLKFAIKEGYFYLVSLHRSIC